MNDQRMLVVEAAGDPNVVGAGAFKLLFSTYFKLDGVSRIGGPPAPRARWPSPKETPKDKWLGDTRCAARVRYDACGRVNGSPADLDQDLGIR